MKPAIHFFIHLSVSEQIEFFEDDAFEELSKNEKIEFLKRILKVKLPPRTTACSLEWLSQMDYHDRYFFKKYIYHLDAAVADTARKAIHRKVEEKERMSKRLARVLREGNTNDRLLLANHFLHEKGRLNEETLISFLTVEDFKVRDTIIKNISTEHELDDARLSAIVKQGVVWYVRSALVEILGRRKSHHLLDIVDELVNDSNVEVKIKLIDALARMKEKKDDSIKPYIRKLAGDPVVWVRKEAQRLLSDM